MAESAATFVLDSFAVMAHFQAESGGEKVLELLEKAGRNEVSLAMSMINVGEVAYLASRRWGKKYARALLDDLRGLPIAFYDATEERILSAAWLKAGHPISYADAFAALLTKELSAQLVTGDLEFKHLKEKVPLLWLG
jgi:predicted nucleic acid-binding protein